MGLFCFFKLIEKPFFNKQLSSNLPFSRTSDFLLLISLSILWRA